MSVQRYCNRLALDEQRHFVSLSQAEAALLLNSRMARSFFKANVRIVGVAARPGPGGLAPGQLGPGESFALHGTPTNQNILAIATEGLKASEGEQWSGYGCYFSYDPRL